MLLLLPAGAAQGDPRDDKKRVDDAVATAASILEGATTRAQEAAKSLAAANAQLPTARERAAVAQGEVAAAEVVANTARREAEAAEKALVDAGRRYEESARKVAAARERVGTFAESAYKGSDLVGFNLLVNARTPIDM